MEKKLFCLTGVIILSFILFSCNMDSGEDPSGDGELIIADHTVVDEYDKIPQQWINEVKKMWINIPGESHSQAYRTGLLLLAGIDARFAVNVTEAGSPESDTDLHLRVCRGVRTQHNSWSYGTGESVWYTNGTGIQTIKNHLLYCNTNNLDIAVIGFGWCWDMTWHNAPGGDPDPVYAVHWAGASEGGPQDDLRWGLDRGDESLTGNPVCMNTYLEATEQYIAFCKDNGYSTKVVFTTGPVDGYTGENGYQRHIKHEYIRDYVRKNNRILFDYADILCYDDDGSVNMTSWNGHSYPVITPTNLGDGSVGHIGNAGALRLAKAQWWMLARIAGWNGK